MWGIYFVNKRPNNQQRQKRKLGQLCDLQNFYNKNKFLRNSTNDSAYGYMTEISYRRIDYYFLEKQVVIPFQFINK